MFDYERYDYWNTKSKKLLMFAFELNKEYWCYVPVKMRLRVPEDETTKPVFVYEEYSWRPVKTVVRRYSETLKTPNGYCWYLVEYLTDSNIPHVMWIKEEKLHYSNPES